MVTVNEEARARAEENVMTYYDDYSEEEKDAFIEGYIVATVYGELAF